MAHPFVSSGLALLFDIDGVLIQSNDIHTQAWEKYLHLHGIPVDVRAIYHRMHGRRNDEIVRDFFGDSLSVEQIDRHGADKEALYRQLMLAEFDAHVTAGVMEFLEKVRGVRAAVVSNAEPANVDFVLDRGGFRSYFQVIVDGHQVECPKPSPEIYLKAAGELHVDPRDCIVFEDSFSGVQAARSAGARVVGINVDDAVRPDVDLNIPDFHSPELIPWLKALRPGR
jgi:beta-phosphoglucomutase